MESGNGVVAERERNGVIEKEGDLKMAEKTSLTAPTNGFGQNMNQPDKSLSANGTEALEGYYFVSNSSQKLEEKIQAKEAEEQLASKIQGSQEAEIKEAKEDIDF
nr:hypothetical protein Iba_chr04aCG11280 [Ipomoea batatas]